MLSDLPTGSIAFNAPIAMDIGESAVVHLVLSMKSTVDELKGEIEEPGERVGATIHVSDLIEAKLTGSAFNITAITPERQPVSQTEATDWKWEVTPQKAGSPMLHLVVNALVDVDGLTVRNLRTFDHQMAVSASWGTQAAAFVSSNWQWLWTAILISAACMDMAKVRSDACKARTCAAVQESEKEIGGAATN